MNKKTTYSLLDQFVFRVPSFPVNYSNSEIYSSKIFKEGIRLASPDLFEALEKCNVDDFNQLPERLKLSVFKYILRSKYRCTPFGLFAACGVGNLGDNSGILLGDIAGARSSTRIDMTYLHALSKYVSEQMEFQNGLTFYSNDSLHKIDGFGYRYIEYKYVNNERKYFLSELEANDDLDKIIHFAKSGIKRASLISLLVDDEITEKESSDYIALLMDNQILVPDSGALSAGNKDMLQKILEWLNDLSSVPDVITTKIRSVRSKLLDLDQQPIGRAVELYQDIEREIAEIDVGFDRKFLFQSDLAVYPVNSSLNTDDLASVWDGICVLNKLTPKSENRILKKFKTDFYNRYETEEIPLMEALDIDTGISLSNMGNGIAHVNPLIDNIGLVENVNTSHSFADGKIESFLLKKYHDYLQSGAYELILEEKDLDQFDEDWSDLSDTFFALTEFKCSGKGRRPLVSIKTVAGASAANLLARFCHSHEDINGIVEKLMKIEDDLVPDHHLLAEVLHLPQSRTGNITYRPNLRSFQIPFLTRNEVEGTTTLPVSDLMVSMPDRNTIVLRSKSLNKQIIPRLTTAHNFGHNSLPVYYFLCALQGEEKRIGLNFSWGQKLNTNVFLPRVRYKNIILSPARWTIPNDVFRKFVRVEVGEVDLNGLNNLRKEYKIADKVYLCKGDNKLLIDFTDKLSTSLLLSEAQKQLLIFEEYTYDHRDMLIRGENNVDSYINEVVLFFYKNK